MSGMIPPIPSEVQLSPGLSHGQRKILGEEARMLGVVEVTKPSSSGEKASASGEELEMKRLTKTMISGRKSALNFPKKKKKKKSFDREIVIIYSRENYQVLCWICVYFAKSFS
jgi:hypothetical protein